MPSDTCDAALRRGNAANGRLWPRFVNFYKEMGWRRFSRFLSISPFIWLVELGYALVARNRGLTGRIFLRKG